MRGKEPKFLCTGIEHTTVFWVWASHLNTIQDFLKIPNDLSRRTFILKFETKKSKFDTKNFWIENFEVTFH